MNKIAKIRNDRMQAQAGRCCYCQNPMWSDDPTAFATLYALSDRQARLLQATAEHLIPRSEGGTNCKANIAAACLFCNTRRHCARQPLTPKQYLQRVRARVAGGKWHGLRIQSVEATAFGVDKAKALSFDPTQSSSQSASHWEPTQDRSLCASG